MSRMVVVHRLLGFRFVIYTLDHKPAHVHVVGPGRAKIDLLGPNGTPEVVYSVGINRADLRRLLIAATMQQAHFLAEWEKIHGPID